MTKELFQKFIGYIKRIGMSFKDVHLLDSDDDSVYRLDEASKICVDFASGKQASLLKKWFSENGVENVVLDEENGCFAVSQTSEEDDEAVQQAVFSSDTDLNGNNNDKDANGGDSTQEENTQETEKEAQPQKLTAQDVKNMGDEQILPQIMQKKQDNLDASAKQELKNRAAQMFQKFQTGTVSDGDRKNIANAIINLQNNGGLQESTISSSDSKGCFIERIVDAVVKDMEEQ